MFDHQSGAQMIDEYYHTIVLYINLRDRTTSKLKKNNTTRVISDESTLFKLKTD